MIIHQLQQENWGVCGFVSAIQAACANGKGTQIAGQPITSRFNGQAALKGEVLATSHDLLKHFVKIFDTNCSATEAVSIVAFTRLFGGEFLKPKKDVYALSDYCNMMYEDKTFIDVMPATSEKPGLGFAMTPEAMDFLLRTVFSFKINPFRRITATEWKDIKVSDKDFTQFKNAIVGFSRNANDDPANYYGLKHWVYIDPEGKPYSWGKKYNSVKDFFAHPIGYERITHVFNVGNN